MSRFATAFAFSRAERDIIRRHQTPRSVERWLRGLPYNKEERGETLRSFRGVVRHGIVHCLEGALCAATILEQHGYPPLLLSLESIDQLDHVIFAFREGGRWGSVARSRDPPAWAQGRVPLSSRAGPQLRGPLRRLHGPHHRLRRRGPSRTICSR